MINGFLNVYKEAGYTSNDVVAILRGILRQRKIGHAGTLDPAAVGVLPVLLGTATRLSEYLTDHDKTYRTVLMLGIETDSQDMTGTVIHECAGELPAEQMIRDAVLSFRGGYDQIPPMYSAKQVNGKRLYDLAREGLSVERKPVHVQIDDIRIEAIEGREVRFTVTCSRGTYIRTLCHDIGRKLGCGGCMKSLERTRVGGFHAEDASTLDQIRAYADAGRLSEKVIPCEELFLDKLRAHTVPEADRLLINGNFLSMDQISLPSRGAGDLIRVCTSGGVFIALYKIDRKRHGYVPFRMLAEQVHA